MITASQARLNVKTFNEQTKSYDNIVLKQIAAGITRASQDGKREMSLLTKNTLSDKVMSFIIGNGYELTCPRNKEDYEPNYINIIRW